MHLLLLLLCAVLAAAGTAMLRYAVPVEDVAGAALFTSGVVAIVGALILAGLAAAVRSLARIAERLHIQPLPVPPVAAVERDDPAPRPARTASAASAARPSLLGWLGRANPPAPARVAPAAPLVTPEAQPATPPVDLAPLARIPEAPPPPPPMPPPLRAPPKPAPTPNSPATTVYRSGVIDGMAYSLFMDGSIEAELPTGRVKFATIDELQQYLVSRKS
ncbi:MAG: hypothetical protein E6G97_22535 [Alphaproteobacteria bacterium]|nr:MAG: hypothetical protein E6G97_22535 [Alphaproteobacteria bacterium]